MKRTKEMFRFGIGFWVGGFVYSLINLLMNLKNVAQFHILNYDYIITGVAVIGLVLNLILLRRMKK